ncbi:RHS repeat-associated core domain-containing protein [Chryseobacterium wanjuense]|uniref:RHS repeat-associated core domain-containing protein n=2 Tax=Chryseobacterium wanjuense TaxID=356305 RepID=A0A1I0RHV2_9FLAO|nr:RHS repeat-associated core domain-containing protein [Chryseobacterium wanjuense]
MNHLKSGTAFFGQASYKNHKYNGVELQETGIYATDWRGYMPDIGRFAGMDALAEDYADQTPFHFAMNNPANYADPTGLYSVSQGGDRIDLDPSEFGAFFKKYKNGINGPIGSVFNEIQTNTNDYSLTQNLPELTIQGSKLKHAFTGDYFFNSDKNAIFNHLNKHIGVMTTFSEHKLDKVEQWANSDNFALKFSYKTVNDAYTFAQVFDGGLMERPEWESPFGGNYGNLDGTPNYHQEEGFANTLSTIYSTVRSLKVVKEFAVEGLNIASKMNAAQFSRVFKGTAIARATPATRGLLNRNLNKGIGYVNGQVESGMKAPAIVKFFGNMFKSKDKK